MILRNQKESWKRRFAATFFLILLFACNTNSQDLDLDVPFVPTPQVVVDRMLELAGVGPGDYVIDLGSGDGRIVVSAAKRGAIGHGVDLNPQRIREARENAQKEGVTDRVVFVREDLFETDFRTASVVTMYLLSSVNLKLRPRILEELRPGTRIVSYSFDMDEWKPDVEDSVSANGSTGGYEVYLWIVPAQVDGDWAWTSSSGRFSMTIDQQFQEVDVSFGDSGRDLKVTRASLKGPKLEILAEGSGASYLYYGHVEGDQISGTVQIREGNDSRIENWVATRR
ncbi:MAG TPA: class I SAM-dependent methyltransferase [Acidobacteriota bacterium]|nr:class I SAM-dependent methyltransferase [Acidobacteriota bacterium]